MTSLNTGGEQTQAIISTILEKCIAEKNYKSLMIPINYVQERVAFYTGISKNDIVRLNEALQTDNSEHSLSIRHRELIMKGLLHFYGNVKLPTLNEVYDLVRKQTILPPLAQFTKEMVGLGYCYRKTSNGYLLMEDPAMTFERYHYLKKILKFRNKRNSTLFYMDERVIDESCTFPKPTDNMNEKTMSESLLYCYVVSQNGMVEGMFCNYINGDEIINWIKHVVMPYFGSSSIIVISNSFIYGRENNNPPLPYASKDTMLKWLRTNNIPCNDNMRKADLYALITKYPPVRASHNVDMLFKAHGHEVLRLPTSLQDLTPTELAWQDMKLALQNKGKQNLFTLKEYVHDYIKTVLRSVDKWLQYEKNVQEIEKKMFDLDESIEVLLDSYNFEIDDPLFKCELSKLPNNVIELQ